MNTKKIAQQVMERVQAQYSPPLGTMDLFLTQDCNFRCDYCFVGAKRPIYMSEETALKGINLLFRESRNAPRVGIVFFGGEPLLNISVLKAAVAHAQALGKYYHKRPRFSITTNGSLLTEDICAYLTKAGVVIMLSLDGSEEVHNRHRKYADGRATFNDVMRGVKNVLKIQGFAGIRMTISPQDAHTLYDDVVWLYRSAHVTSFTICHNTYAKWGDDDIDVFLEQVRRVNDLCVSEAKQLRGFRLLENVTLARLCDHGKAGRVCSAGATGISVTPEGDLFACSRFIQHPEYTIGNVDEGRVFNEAYREIMCYQMEAKKECGSCVAEPLCRGGCIAVNLDMTGHLQQKSRRDCRIHSQLQRMLLEDRELLRVSRLAPLSGTHNTCVY